MISNTKNRILRLTLTACISLIINSLCLAQNKPSALNISGSVLITNNGFSNIPSFSLGKPAAIFNFTLGGKRLSFEPELRFSYEGKPWSFLFWGRYKIIDNKKYQLGVGIHPGFNFKTETGIVNGEESDYMITRRYLTGEINQSLPLSENMSVGLYYLYGRGVDLGTAPNTHYLSLRAGFSNIRLTNKLNMAINPQVFYLNTASKNGTYLASAISLSKADCPISLGAMFNKTIKSEIASKDFNWNVSLKYSFGGKYKKS